MPLAFAHHDVRRWEGAKGEKGEKVEKRETGAKLKSREASGSGAGGGPADEGEGDGGCEQREQAESARDKGGEQRWRGERPGTRGGGGGGRAGRQRPGAGDEPDQPDGDPEARVPRRIQEGEATGEEHHDDRDVQAFDHAEAGARPHRARAFGGGPREGRRVGRGGGPSARERGGGDGAAAAPGGVGRGVGGGRRSGNGQERPCLINGRTARAVSTEW